MFDPRTLPSKPRRLTSDSIMASLADSISRIRFGRSVRSMDALHQLYRRTFDLELALCKDFCLAPAGWLDRHQVMLPVEFKLLTVEQLRFRLERMLHAPKNLEAIAFLRKTISNFAGIEGNQGPPLASNPGRLAGALFKFRQEHPDFADTLIRGDLERGIQMIANGQMQASAYGEARRLCPTGWCS